MSTQRDLSPPVEQPVEVAATPAPAAPVAMRSMSSGANPDVFFHLDLMRSLQLHRRLFLWIVGFGLAAATGYFLTAWPVYVAQTIVYIQPAPPQLMGNQAIHNWPYDQNTYESYLQQQINNVMRSDVLRSALHRLPARSWQRDGETEQAAVERLGRKLTVERMGNSYQISIAAKSSQAAFAAQIANSVAAAFVETARIDLRAGDPERIKLLGEERDRIQKALDNDRTEQEQVNRALGVATAASAGVDPYETQINEVKLELTKAREAHDEASARLTTMATTASASSAALDAEADEIIAADAGLVSMKASLNQRRALLISQMANLTPNHPQYKQDADELAQINGSLENMMKDLRAKAAAHIQQRLKNDLERTSAFETKLNAQLGQLSSAAGSATSRLQRANDLALDIQRLQTRFTAVDEQYRNLTLENKAPGAAYITSPAMAPLHPSTDRLMRNLFIILLGTLLLAAAAAVAAQKLDPRVYIATDIERVLGFSPMAQLPDFHEVSGGVGEEYMLRLAAAIEHAYQQNGLKSCVITGVAPGAGTSTVASRVSTMLEGMGRSTVLVNASGTPSPNGKGGVGGGFDLVTTNGRPSSLLQQMAEEMDEDTIVLTDTAPLLTSGETEYMARFVDSAIVVIQSGITTRAQLREVAQTLQRLEVTAVGFVLNRVSIGKANPSFRQSVRAVEQRLAMQNRARDRHTTRTRPSGHHTSDTDEVPAVVTDPKPVEPPDPFDFQSDSSSTQGWSSEARPSSAGSPPTPSEQPGAGSSRSAMSSEPEAAEAGPTGSRRVARGRGEPLRSTPTPAQAVSPPPGEDAAPPMPPSERVAPARPAAPRRTVTPSNPQPLRSPAGSARPAAPPVNLPVERWTAPAPLASEEPFPGDLASERDDAGYTAATRLGGLRNLLVSLGRRSLNHEGETGVDSKPDIEPRFERATVRPAYPEPPEPESDVPESGVPARLNAEPEFLPPKPMVELEKEREVVRPAPAAPRRDNADSDDIQTLPSWRGQYRKKRYPPL